ncbi:sensor histidine kinase [Sulfitobacter albidus]|uniref:C4-dicarboxylate transport sensor protein DctB n=2 Tax=Sulfitobacter albidus TaxID=2829501 RepID=A0A975JGV5_9RHOB|nr:sensor histidine kinase [Sulfitobacter albidus]
MPRIVFVVLYLLAVAGVSLGVWRVATQVGLGQLAARAQADLALSSDRLTGQLQRYRDLAVNMADHPQVTRVLAGAVQPEDVALLRRVADRTAAQDVIVVDLTGRVMAAAEDGTLAQGARPFVQRALNGALGRGYGPATGGVPRSYFYAAPVFDRQSRVLGAIVVATDLSSVEYAWRSDTAAVFFRDASGRVQVSNRSELVGWRRPAGGLGLQPAEGPAPAFSAHVEAGFEIWRLGWGRYLPDEALHLARDLPVIGMTGEVLSDVAPVRRLALSQAAAVAALCLALGALLFLATERRRTLARANAQLEARVAERTRALSETNAALRREVTERRQAQDALARAQDELVQASRLSALGQLSAGISHELNQPLMAVQSFAENGRAFLERGQAERAGENLGRISDMAHRMGRIIKNLRAFSKQESVAQTQVDLTGVIAAALELTQARRETLGVTLDYSAPDGPVWVRGGEVRLGQVFVNLITNALDAMAEVEERRLILTVQTGAQVTVTLADTGPGIAQAERIFDPFYSTKEVGAAKGIGLGLSISYAIVQSMGGELRARNGKTGAEFTVTLNAATAEAAA